MSHDHYLGGAAAAGICMLLAGFMWAIQPKQSLQTSTTNLNSAHIRTVRIPVPMANSNSPRLIVDPKAVEAYVNQAGVRTPERITALRQEKPNLHLLKPKPRIRTVNIMPRESQPGPSQTMPSESQRGPE
jgi:hypothetical protein